MIFVRRFSPLALSTLAAIAAISVGMGQQAIAEPEADVEPVQSNSLELENGRDPFEGTSGEADTRVDMFELIHRAKLGGGRSMDEFRLGTEQNIDDAAAQFRNRQLQQLEPGNIEILPDREPDMSGRTSEFE
ncbi:MAG: hypothetical protein D6680_15830 [Cyanobacteria bacterium J007]|jgi:hypothetical protein|nr:MAG: hypothetical protein D6680_15830 [Cyanobacteria bacterium J007]